MISKNAPMRDACSWQTWRWMIWVDPCQTASGLNCQTASGRDWRSAVQRQLAVVDMQTHLTGATKDSPCVIWLGSGLAEVVHLDAV